METSHRQHPPGTMTPTENDFMEKTNIYLREHNLEITFLQFFLNGVRGLLDVGPGEKTFYLTLPIKESQSKKEIRRCLELLTAKIVEAIEAMECKRADG